MHIRNFRLRNSWRNSLLAVLGHTPLFNVMITVQNAPMEDLELTGLTVTQETSQITTTRFDMEWHVWEHLDNLTLLVFYRTDLFDRSTIERMIRSFEFLLEQVLSDIECKVQPISSVRSSNSRSAFIDPGWIIVESRMLPN